MLFFRSRKAKAKPQDAPAPNDAQASAAPQQREAEPPAPITIKQSQPTTTQPQDSEPEANRSKLQPKEKPEEKKPSKGGWFGLGKRLARIFVDGKKLDAATREELEVLLLQSDAGVTTTEAILEELSARLKKQVASDPLATLEVIVTERLLSRESELLPAQPDGKLHVLLLVGSNGSGKTTSLAKLAHYYAKAGYKPIFAAGDTFRAAAIEQLQHWGERLGLSTIAHKQGGDSAAVIYDAIQAATARGYDLVLADTAGRLHNKQQLLDELQKIHRIATKAKQDAELHSVLVLDAITGASAVPMVQMFAGAVALSGLIVTKLDGSSRGGTVLALADTVPIAFLGLGEKIDDLQPFRASDYARQLLK